MDKRIHGIFFFSPQISITIFRTKLNDNDNRSTDLIGKRIPFRDLSLFIFGLIVCLSTAMDNGEKREIFFI